jgi:hypothetical protein
VSASESARNNENPLIEEPVAEISENQQELRRLVGIGYLEDNKRDQGESARLAPFVRGSENPPRDSEK